MMKRQQQRLKRKIGRLSIEVYTDPSNPAGFSSPHKVHQQLKTMGHGMEHATAHQVEQALTALPSYSRHRQIRKRDHTMTTRAEDVDHRWQVDLMNVSSFDPSVNDNYRYMLFIVDVFSRRLLVVPLYTCSSNEVSDALELIFMTTGRIPRTLTSDSGKEFTGNPFRLLCNKYDIQQYCVLSETTHASVVERAIRTMRTRIGKLMTFSGNKRYIDDLGNMVNAYNNSVHSTIGMSPNDAASSVANRQLALFHLQHRLNRTRKNERVRRRNEPLPFRAGDEARTPLSFKRFRKSHEPSFSEETHRITESFRNDKSRPVSRLTGQRNKQVFYPFNLSRAT